MQKILVTDSVFIFPEHEATLRAAGFEVERLAKEHATDSELIEALHDKVGYILGGIERVNDTVIASAEQLKAIAFTGADWAGFITGHEAATKRGIIITNTPGSTTFAVAEFTLTLLLAMLRRVFELGGPGQETFITTHSLNEMSIGIVGMGRIGERVTRMLVGLGCKEICYWNRTRKPALEAELGITYMPLKKLVAHCGVVSTHVSSQAGQLLDKALLDTAKKDTLFINTGAHTTFDMNALYEQLAVGHIRAAFDIGGAVPKDERFETLAIANWYSTNSNTGYNTYATLEIGSTMATNSIMNVLLHGDDQYRVN